MVSASDTVAVLSVMHMENNYTVLISCSLLLTVTI